MCLRPDATFVLFRGGRRRGYTLVEILVATTLTLILMTAVVTVFAGVGDGISKSRRAMEQFDRLRTTVQQLRVDLQGATAMPFDGHPVRTEESRGYFEIIEASILPAPQAINDTLSMPSSFSLSITNTNTDMTVGTGANVLATPAALAWAQTLAQQNPGLNLNVSAGTSNAGHAQGDILMFTTRNAMRPFLGRYALNVDSTNPTLQSDVAEVAWFLRGNVLHRRVLLVAPGVNQNSSFAGQNPNTFFQTNDISVRLMNGQNRQKGQPSQLVANSLADLTRRENRFAHPASSFPFDARAWGLLGLPTLAECTSSGWMGPPTGANTWLSGTTPPPNGGLSAYHPPAQNQDYIDLWDNAKIAAAFGMPAGLSPDLFLCNGKTDTQTRLADDVILTNVIGFDVKVWEPAVNGGQGGYVDLGYWNAPVTSTVVNPPLVYPPPNSSTPRFQHVGAPRSGLAAAAQSHQPPQAPRVFDTYSFSYENEGIYNIDNNGNRSPLSPPYPAPLKSALGPWPAGTSTNGFDDDGDGIIDDATELITQPPYPVPLRGIQVTIRCFEPDSHQIRQVTIEQDFLPK